MKSIGMDAIAEPLRMPRYALTFAPSIQDSTCSKEYVTLRDTRTYLSYVYVSRFISIPRSRLT